MPIYSCNKQFIHYVETENDKLPSGLKYLGQQIVSEDYNLLETVWQKWNTEYDKI